MRLSLLLHRTPQNMLPRFLSENVYHYAK